MTTPYQDMDPQPEILLEQRFYDDVELWLPIIKEASLYPPPHKPGDEIEPGNRAAFEVMLHPLIVKSCRPVNKDGVWKWEIELE